ncbi:hypothetical protein N7493_002466 [Penicillium malachiteum]|uniref:Uncharacterized protein n=1 Tax=Penicillium malachiteum TaxID=1324776 RepID=A0AAD6HS05_9EURO|nr:hypothetical protein N7493_002466 [Penicillium malachiteum]
MAQFQRTPSISISESPSQGTSNPVLKVYKLTRLSDDDLCEPLFVRTDPITGGGKLHRIVKCKKDRTGLWIMKHTASVTPDPQLRATCSKFEIGCTTSSYHLSWNAVLDRLAQSNELVDLQGANKGFKGPPGPLSRRNTGLGYDPEPMVMETGMSLSNNHLIRELDSYGMLFTNQYDPRLTGSD